MSGRRSALLAALLGLAPGVANACAVCGGGNPANRFAFFASTIALSLLPLSMFTGGLLFLRSRLRDQLAEEFAEREAVAPTAEAPTVMVPMAAPSPSR